VSKINKVKLVEDENEKVGMGGKNMTRGKSPGTGMSFLVRFIQKGKISRTVLRRKRSKKIAGIFQVRKGPKKRDTKGQVKETMGGMAKMEAKSLLSGGARGGKKEGRMESQLGQLRRY